MNLVNHTFFLLKPDAFERGLQNDIFHNLYLAGFSVVMLKDFSPAPTAKVMEHYEHLKDKPFFLEVMNYMTRGRVLAGVVAGPAGEDAISKLHDLVGATDPSKAAPDTIRGLFGDKESMENLIHSSDSYESYVRETKLWMGIDVEEEEKEQPSLESLVNNLPSKLVGNQVVVSKGAVLDLVRRYKKGESS